MCHSTAVSLVRLRQGHQLASRIHLQKTVISGYTNQIRVRAMATSSQETVPIKKRVVAGSFLFQIPNGDDTQAKVALFRRSSKVRTYQHKLAPCSGSVEVDDASPLAAALREIREETTLPTSSLDLLRVGKPYAFIDESIGREWSINPFAFRIKEVTEGGKGVEGITLDWEHEGIEWFDPMQVNGSDEFGGVPRLIESLRRVWPEYDLGSEAGRVFTSGLQRLRDDRAVEDKELAGIVITTLRDMIRHLAFTHSVDESWWGKVRMAAWHICQCRATIDAVITNAVVKALNAIEAIYINDTATGDKAQRMIKVLDELVDACITEEGFSNSEAITQESKCTGKEMKRYFNGL